MLTRSDALKAKHVLSKWLAKKGDRMTVWEEETVELLLTSPVGDRACTKLGTTLHHVRDLLRLSDAAMPYRLDDYGVRHQVAKLQELRQAAGQTTSTDFLRSAAAILSGAAGYRIASNLQRLDAVLTILWEMPRAATAEASR